MGITTCIAREFSTLFIVTMQYFAVCIANTGVACPLLVESVCALGRTTQSECLSHSTLVFRVLKRSRVVKPYLPAIGLAANKNVVGVVGKIESHPSHEATPLHQRGVTSMPTYLPYILPKLI